MGKAAQRRLRHRGEHLAELSHRDPQRFEAAWEKRVDSWLEEIQDRARQWRSGDIEGWRQLFEIADRAVSAIRGCSPAARRRHLQATIDLFEHVCAVEVASIVDRRLYRTEAMDTDRLFFGSINRGVDKPLCWHEFGLAAKSNAAV